MFCFVNVFLYFVYIIVFFSVLPFGVINDNNNNYDSTLRYRDIKQSCDPYVTRSIPLSVFLSDCHNAPRAITVNFRAIVTMNIWCKNCRMWQLLYTLTETINTMFSVVNVLLQKSSCFQLLLFKTLYISQGSVATHIHVGNPMPKVEPTG